MQRFLGLLLFLTPLLAGSPRPLLGEETPAPRWVAARDAAPGEGVAQVSHEAWTSRRPPAGEYDLIGLHRYRGQLPATSVLLYFPGTFMNGVLAKKPAALPQEDHNLWLFLARRGVDVYTLDYRTHAVPREGVENLSFMAGWGMEAFTGDALAALAFVRTDAAGLPLFVAGFSRGVAFAYATAAAEPKAVAGVVALDGLFKRAKAKGDGPDDPAAALAAQGKWAHDVGGSRGWAMRQRLMEAAAADAAAPALEAEGTVGAQLAEILYRAWGPGVLANPVEGPRKGVSSIAVLARLMAGYDRFYPLIQDLEAAAWGDAGDDPRTSMDDGWPALRMPVFFVGSTGMGAEFLMDGLASAAHCADGRPEIHVLEGYGHLDVLVGERARNDVFEPMLDWIRRTARNQS